MERKIRIVTNELSEKDLDELYLKIAITNNGLIGYILPSTYSSIGTLQACMDDIQRHQEKYKSSYNWKSLELEDITQHKTIIDNDYVRVRKLEMIIEKMITDKHDMY